MPRALSHALALLLAAALCACHDEGPRWIRLAQGYEPPALLELARTWQSEAGLDPAGVREVLAGVQVRVPLAPEDWRQVDGHWRCRLPAGALRRGAPGTLQLARDEQHFVPGPAEGALPPGQFRLEQDEVVLALPPGKAPPALALEQRLEQGRRSEEGVWQLRDGLEYGDGIPLWPARAAHVELALPAESALTLDLRWSGRGAGPLVFRVRLDGAPLLELPLASEELAHTAHPVLLPLPETRMARLEFSCEGPPGCLLLFAPRIVPRAIGRYGARPWGSARPDVVLFLADTFRADNLALYGGDPSWTPALNAFAARALACARARSNAAWTLPSVASLLTGFAPGQHTATAKGQLLPNRLVTLAERFARAGYRTGAVTDAAFVSPNFGLDQGFETFRANDSANWDLDWTLARAREFLQNDDGRPVFLLVHTYRAHMPYRVGPEEDDQAYAALQERYRLHTEQERARELAQQRGLAGMTPEWRTLLAEAGPRYAELYRAGVRDVDRGFGELLAELERCGLAATGVVVFTSDHGEALGENDEFFHDGPLWESKLRVPLLLGGVGLAAGRIEPNVTLLDVAPTLARLAGLEPDPAWLGQDLRTVTSERPVLAFRQNETTQVALVEGTQKLLAHDLEGLEAGRYDAAYALDADPREEHALAPVDWAGELARRNATLVRRATGPLADAADALIHPDAERALKDIGY